MKMFTYIKDNSQRVERKNFQLIGELELWKHTVYRFAEQNLFIDTDSDDVLHACATDPRLKGVTAYRRDERFVAMENDANNKLSPALLMVDQFLDRHVPDPDEKIVLFHVTSPFLSLDTVAHALTYLDGECDVVHSTHVIQDFAWFGPDLAPLNFDPSVVQRTQDLEKIHISNGAFFMFTKRTFKKFANRFGEQNYFYPLNRVESIEIDNYDDLHLARIVYEGSKK